MNFKILSIRVFQKLILLQAIVLLIVTPAFADAYSDEGEKLYKLGDYPKAAKYFAQSLQTSPNSRSLYYAGCCFLKLGQNDSAKNTFQLLIDNYPQTQEAKLAKIAMQSLSDRSSSVDHSNDVGSTNSQSTSSAHTLKIKPTISDPFADKLISIFRHTENTDRIIDIVKGGLTKVPDHVKKVLSNNDYQVLIAPMIMDVTDTQDSKPRGYNNGGGWDNAGGVFLPSSKRVVVGERVSWRCNPPTFNSLAGATVRHEIGHAYDQYMGKTLLNSWNISSSPLFRQTYAADAQNLTNTQRRTFEYFVQPDGAGENELFAELFYTNCLQENENARRSKSAQELAHAFPKTFELVQDLIAQRGLERFSTQE